MDAVKLVFFFLGVGDMWLVVVVIVAGLFVCLLVCLVCLKRLALGCSPCQWPRGWYLMFVRDSYNKKPSLAMIASLKVKFAFPFYIYI